MIKILPCILILCSVLVLSNSQTVNLAETKDQFIRLSYMEPWANEDVKLLFEAVLKRPLKYDESMTAVCSKQGEDGNIQQGDKAFALQFYCEVWYGCANNLLIRSLLYSSKLSKTEPVTWQGSEKEYSLFQSGPFGKVETGRYDITYEIFNEQLNELGLPESIHTEDGEHLPEWNCWINFNDHQSQTTLTSDIELTEGWYKFYNGELAEGQQIIEEDLQEEDDDAEEQTEDEEGEEENTGTQEDTETEQEDEGDQDTETGTVTEDDTQTEEDNQDESSEETNDDEEKPHIEDEAEENPNELEPEDHVQEKEDEESGEIENQPEDRNEENGNEDQDTTEDAGEGNEGSEASTDNQNTESEGESTDEEDFDIDEATLKEMEDANKGIGDEVKEVASLVKQLLEEELAQAGNEVG